MGPLRPAPTFDVGSGRGATMQRRGLGPNAKHWRVRWRSDCGPEPTQPTPSQHMQCWQRLTISYWWPEDSAQSTWCDVCGSSWQCGCP